VPACPGDPRDPRHAGRGRQRGLSPAHEDAGDDPDSSAGHGQERPVVLVGGSDAHR
jgi:hypothetical protein